MITQAMKSLNTSDLVYRSLCLLGQDIGLTCKDFQTLCRRYRNEGLPFITKTLPSLSKALLRGLATGVFSLPSSFKSRKPKSALPAFLGSLFAKVFSENGTLLDSADPYAILVIRQFCEFVYKADLPRKEADDQKVVDGFCATEEELSRLVIEWDPVLLMANAVASELVGDLDFSEIKPHHGPGATANVDRIDKYDHQLSPSLPSVYTFGKTFFFNENDALTRLDRYPVWSTSDYYRSRSTAKVVLVPKDSRGPRLISEEPAENMWVQQGIESMLKDRLETHSLTAGQVNFTDQTINRDLALRHSVDRAYSTLDLKDASDRVSMALVEKVFFGTPFLDILRVVRSDRTILPDGRVVVLHKHAPMGSALCFPVMAMTIYILLYVGLIGLGLDPSEARRYVYVYGDDIVVKTEYARFAMDLLERYGLRVNRDKSFIDCHFLESCGMDAYNGNVVTPIRLKKCDISSSQDRTKPSKRLIKEKPTVLVSMTETANLLAASGYMRASEFFFTYSETWLGPLPYGTPRSPYLCRHIPTTSINMVPEANALVKGLRWRTPMVTERKPEGYNPLGIEYRAWTTKSTTTKRVGSSHTYAHLIRIWDQLGRDRNLPEQGSYTLPRSTVLTRVWIDHYDMSDVVSIKY